MQPKIVYEKELAIHIFVGEEKNKKIAILEDADLKFWLVESLEDGPFDNIEQVESFIDEKLKYVG